MKFYYTFSRKFLLLILCILILIVCFASRFSEVSGEQNTGDTNQKRVDFLYSIGCVVDEKDFDKKTITIPVSFGDVYNKYNEIQKSADYDLSLYKGEKCEMFSFDVEKYKDFNPEDYAKANLIVYNGRIIGGDISSSKIGGKMYPLKR